MQIDYNRDGFIGMDKFMDTIRVERFGFWFGL